MKKTIFLLLFNLIFISAQSQTKSYFPTLSKAVVDTFHKANFNYDKKCTRLINRSCSTLDKKDPFYCSEEVLIEGGVVVARVKVPAMKDSIDILFSEGMSADPGFDIYTRNMKNIGGFSCYDFYINSSGTIYISGHTNKMFDKRMKFQVQKDTIVEVKQPYYFVGLKGKTLKDIVLYKDKVGPEIVAQLPKGYEVQVLLAEPSIIEYDSELFYLVKSDFGLVGWLRLKTEDFMDPVIEGLYYAGD